LKRPALPAVAGNSKNFGFVMDIRTEIESVMYDNAQNDRRWLQSGLSAVSVLYGAGVRLRKMAYGKGVRRAARLPCIVFSVGNITLGGTGKTPMTIYLAERIRSYGYRVAVISRGYRGSAEAQGGVVSDGREILMQASACGDEPFMMATVLKNIPVLIGRDRYQVGTVAVKRFNPQVILLDDAFQHIQLARDLDIVLIDAQKPFGNGRLFPRGVLRETEEALARCSAMILTRTGEDPSAGVQKVRLYAPELPLFHSSHRSFVVGVVPGKKTGGMIGPGREKNGDLIHLKGKRVFLFSGIARNDDFGRTVEQIGCRIKGVSFFPDHYRYSQAVLENIMQSAEKNGADFIVTTEKDFSRIPDGVEWPVDLVVMGVKICFSDGKFDQFVEKKLAELDLKRLENSAGV